jgi:cell division protein FtsL
MDRMNVAYDLSFYEMEQERQIARKAKKESVLINAQTKFSLGRKIANILSIAALLTLIIAVVATNAAITTTGTQIADIEDEIVLLQSEKSYLEFTLESRMTLDQIESYAENQLGMVKMDASQKKYVELENENKIVVNQSPVKEKLDEAMQPILSYLLP